MRGNRIAAAAVVVASILAGVALDSRHAVARPLDDVLATRELRVIVYEENEPFSWRDADEPRGFDVDLGKALAAKLGVEARFDFRAQGERVDQDLRTNLLRGTFGGGAVGDVMLHVPVDREYLYGRVANVVVVNPYFFQRVALGLTADWTGDVTSFDVFKSKKVVVQLGTVADYFLMRYDNGALVDNVVHYVWPSQGAKKIAAGQAAAIVGVQSSLEALLRPHAERLQMRWSTPPMPGLARGSWQLGMGFSENSRDLSYALGKALADLKAEGALEEIARQHGVTYLSPPVE